MLPDLGYYLHTYLERLRKITTIISVDVRQPDSYLNPGTPDLAAELQSPTRISVPRLKFKSILPIAGRDLNLRPPEYKRGEFRFCRSVHLHTFKWINQPDVPINYRFIVYRLTIILPTWRIWWAPNASKWHMGFKFGKIMGMNESTFIYSNSINTYPANVENMVSS